MNYNLIYSNLMERAKNRILDGYVENHHIVPRCLGGSDDNNNIAVLTAREHYIAHQLLIKIYPRHYGLLYSAMLMCISTKTHGGNRSHNRIYEWIRIQFSKEVSKRQSGSNNSQFGTCWITNFNEQKCIKIQKDQLSIWLELGWIKKRVRNFDRHYCKICDGYLTGSSTVYCSDECKKKAVLPPRPSRFRDSIDELCEEYKNLRSVKATLIKFGFCGTGGPAVELMKELRRRNIAA